MRSRALRPSPPLQCKLAELAAAMLMQARGFMAWMHAVAPPPALRAELGCRTLALTPATPPCPACHHCAEYSSSLGDFLEGHDLGNMTDVKRCATPSSLVLAPQPCLPAGLLGLAALPSPLGLRRIAANRQRPCASECTPLQRMTVPTNAAFRSLPVPLTVPRLPPNPVPAACTTWPPT